MSCSRRRAARGARAFASAHASPRALALARWLGGRVSRVCPSCAACVPPVRPLLLSRRAACRSGVGRETACREQSPVAWEWGSARY